MFYSSGTGLPARWSMFAAMNGETKKKNIDALLDDTCWVYIQRDQEDSFIVGITYDAGFFGKESAAGRDILYRRRFDDTLSAAGYRMVLNGLSRSSIQKIVDRFAETHTDETNDAI